MREFDHGFEPFVERQELLAKFAQRVQDTVDGLRMNSHSEAMKATLEKIRSQSFKVLILGEFKSGKSTFINALIGEKILPSFARPCTAIINEIQYGEKPAAILYHKQPPGKSEAIPVEKIEDYVVIKDASTEGEESPFERLDLYWPLPLCKNRVILIDSPGLNEAKVRTSVTMGYAPTADTVLFVCPCDRPLAETEINTLRNLQDLGFNQVFVIMNRFDVIEECEHADVKKYVYTKLSNASDLGKRGIHFVSALKALRGKMNNDQTSYAASGFASLEDELKNFLVYDRGRIKTLQPATQLLQLIAKIETDIAHTRHMLTQNVEKLRSHYQSAQEPLRQLELQSETIKRRVTLFRTDMRDMVRYRTREFYVNIERNINEWMKTYTFKMPFNLFSRDFFSPNGAADRVVKEACEYLASRLETETAKWQMESLNPYFNSRFEDFRSELDAMARKFVMDLDEIKTQLSGKVESPTVKGHEVSPLERVLAAAGGLLFDPVSAGVGYAFGAKAMFRNIGLQLGIMLVTAFLISTNPATLLLAALGGGALGGILRGSKTNDMIKENVAQGYAQEIRKNTSKFADEAAQKFFEASLAIENSIDAGLGAELAGAREQVEYALKQMEQGSATVDASLRALDAGKEELHTVQDEVLQLVKTVVSENK